MLSPILQALFYAMLAGVMNGSFALPSKYNKQWNFENLWLNYALWAFIIIPWAFIFILNKDIWAIYQLMPTYTLFILLAGGFSFGIGQACFASSLNLIGFGLGFVINIGLGTGLGFLLPLVILHHDELLAPLGMATLAGLVFIIIGLFLSYRAGQQRDQANHTVDSAANKTYYYSLGVFLAIIAGLFSALQNFTFALTSNMQQLALAAGANSLTAAIIIWPPFLACSFIPYAAYMLHLHNKNAAFSLYAKPHTPRYMGFAIIMALFWYGSLVFYSKAALLIGSLGPVVIWPLFMVLIILTSSFWGWKHQEWQGCSAAIKRKALIAIGALIIAVIILGYSATL